MRAKAWVIEGTFAALLALFVGYLVLKPASSMLAYGSLLGWSGAVTALVVTFQGFRPMETQPSVRDRKQRVLHREVAIDRWGGIHTALSIAATLIIAFHGVLFLGGLMEPSLAIWLGAVAFAALLVLNSSGVLTESKRKFREFGSFKRLHVVLMVIVLVVSLAHIELLLAGSFERAIIQGAIVALVVIFVVFVSVPLTLRPTV